MAHLALPALATHALGGGAVIVIALGPVIIDVVVGVPGQRAQSAEFVEARAGELSDRVLAMAQKRGCGREERGSGVVEEKRGGGVTRIRPSDVPQPRQQRLPESEREWAPAKNKQVKPNNKSVGAIPTTEDDDDEMMVTKGGSPIAKEREREERRRDADGRNLIAVKCELGGASTLRRSWSCWADVEPCEARSRAVGLDAKVTPSPSSSIFKCDRSENSVSASRFYGGRNQHPRSAGRSITRLLSLFVCSISL